MQNTTSIVPRNKTLWTKRGHQPQVVLGWVASLPPVPVWQAHGPKKVWFLVGATGQLDVFPKCCPFIFSRNSFLMGVCWLDEAYTNTFRNDSAAKMWNHGTEQFLKYNLSYITCCLPFWQLPSSKIGKLYPHNSVAPSRSQPFEHESQESMANQINGAKIEVKPGFSLKEWGLG